MWLWEGNPQFATADAKVAYVAWALGEKYSYYAFRSINNETKVSSLPCYLWPPLTFFQKWSGAFQSDVVLAMFSVHLRAICGVPMLLSLIDHPSGALSLAAVSVRRFSCLVTAS